MLIISSRGPNPVSRRHPFIVGLLTLLLILVGACGPQQPINVPPELGASNPQIPVDTKVAAWVTITTSAEQFVGYVLLVGTSVGDSENPIILETTKGAVKLLPGKEQWFSATAEVGSVATSEKLTWQVQIVEMLDEEGHVDDSKLAALKTTLEDSKGLNDGTSLAEPTIIGPAGAVVWEQPPTPANTGVSTFSYSDPVNADVWYLSIAQTDGKLMQVTWGTNKDVAGGKPTTLHENFAHGGSIPLIAIEDTSSIKAVFVY